MSFKCLGFQVLGSCPTLSWYLVKQRRAKIISVRSEFNGVIALPVVLGNADRSLRRGADGFDEVRGMLTRVGGETRKGDGSA